MDSTTELTALNAMLATIGEAPVNTLDGSGLPDAAIALSTLREVVREVLVEGWTFNTDVNYPFYPTAFAPYEITLPPNVMSILPLPGEENIVMRGRKLYNTATRSFSFEGTAEVLVEVVWAMTFDELPEVTRQYIAVRAARRFQGRVVGSELLHGITAEQEQTARWLHRKSNIRIRRKNFLTGSNSVRRIANNR